MEFALRRRHVGGWLVAVAVAFVATSSGLACEVPVGHLVSVQGDVMVAPAGSAAWLRGRLDDPICPFDQIRVGAYGRAQLALARQGASQPVLRIDQNTTLVIRPAEEHTPWWVDLASGALYILSREPRALTIDTPFLNAAVEGTEFLVRALPDGGGVSVFEGKVAASNERGRLLLAAGQSAFAKPGEAPAMDLVIRPREAVQWTLYYPPVLLLSDPAVSSGLAPQVAEGAALASHGETTAAFAAFNAVPDEDRDARYYLLRASALLSAGRVDEASTDVNQALAFDPGAGLAHALLAVIAVAQNDSERAQREAEQAVALAPQSAAAKIALSYVQQSERRLEDARRTVQQAVTDEPGNALAWARLAELWLALGYRQRAMDAATTAQRLAPDLDRAETMLGFAQLLAIRLDTARSTFRRAIALNSADPLPRFGLGLAMIRGGHLTRGRLQIEQAVALDPGSSLLRSYLGLAYFEDRETNPVTYFQRLFEHFPAQENTLAASQFEMAKELDPQDPTPWFYDAIRKQSENRPVEALHDLQRSIALNDNRAVYRSNELLNSDLAGRGASVARIYNDLGFEQLGINEATGALSLDPSNSAAHRFLSDVYATQPRREIARVSELMQAQLLQDVNINPVSPTLSQTNLGIFSRGGPSQLGLNEYTPLFERNQAQLNLSGLVGNHYTHGNEAVLSGVYDNISVSAGQMYYSTNGFRKNDDVENNIGNFFMQGELTPEFNLQAELFIRRSEYGDLFLPYQSANYIESIHHDLDQDVFRVGGRYSPNPNGDFLGSVLVGKRHLKGTSVPNDLRLEDDSVQGEGAYLLHRDAISGQVGFGVYDVDRKRREIVFDGFDPASDTDETQKDSVRHYTGYVYSNIEFPDQSVVWTIGLSYDEASSQDQNKSKINPKFGIRWQPIDGMRIRGAVFRTLSAPFVADRTIQPTQVAGFNQFFDDAIGTETWVYAAAADVALTSSLTVGVEASKRSYDEPLNTSEGQFSYDSRREYLAKGYLYWAINESMSTITEVNYDRFKANPKSDSAFPESVTTLSIPVAFRYFGSSGLIGSITGNFVHQDVSMRNSDSSDDGNNAAFLFDASLGYRLPQRRGLMSISVLNIFDQHLNYQNDSFREFRDAYGGPNSVQSSGVSLDRTILGTISLSF